MTEDEKLMKSIEVIVDCNSMANRLLLATASVLRGTGVSRHAAGTDVKYLKSYPINGFI
jgi:hypothetical protein